MAFPNQQGAHLTAHASEHQDTSPQAYHQSISTPPGDEGNTAKNCLLRFNKSSSKLLGRASRAGKKILRQQFQHQPPAISSNIGNSQFQLMPSTTSAGCLFVGPILLLGVMLRLLGLMTALDYDISLAGSFMLNFAVSESVGCLAGCYVGTWLLDLLKMNLLDPVQSLAGESPLASS
ncbi:hypothetical protein Nepgr_015802 [Nepenthes gracilis]|uniref:Uncharacterized protein n=1 Tax=Nepenthes gracilis TaxID=150966 RepID=A0AAD3SP95_NEPGR|nr:hypothetical protein Nepgr_015802 [Nepenthes gracilis]